MVAIIGAGISGLSTAYFLQKNNIDFVLFENKITAGGYIQSQKVGEYLLEYGPNSILSDAQTLTLIQDLGLDSEILLPKAIASDRYIFKNKAYRKLPTHPLKIFTSNFFSIYSKFKIIKDFFSAKQLVNKGITVKDFFTTYFGKEITNYAIDPFMSGIYAGDISSMILHEIMPNLIQYKSKNGSILQKLIKNGGKRKKTHSFKNGMQSLTDALYAKVKSHIVLTNVAKINLLASNKIEIVTNQKRYTFAAVVVAIPAFKLADIQGFACFKTIEYAPMAVVHSAFKKVDVAHNLQGFGGLHPNIENCFSLGSIWTSSIFEHRCPDDEVLFTTFVGGMCHKANVQLSETEIKVKVAAELAEKFAISTYLPTFQHIYIWRQAIPQYNAAYVAQKSKILELENQNVYICSNWHQGVALTACIQKAQNLANKLSL